MSFRARIERFYFTGEWADLRLGSVPLCLSSLQDLPQLILHARHVVFLKDSNSFLQHDCFQPLSGYQTKKCPDERALFTPRDMTCFSERQRLNHRQQSGSIFKKSSKPAANLFFITYGYPKSPEKILSALAFKLSQRWAIEFLVLQLCSEIDAVCIFLWQHSFFFSKVSANALKQWVLVHQMTTQSLRVMTQVLIRRYAT